MKVKAIGFSCLIAAVALLSWLSLAAELRTSRASSGVAPVSAWPDEPGSLIPGRRLGALPETGLSPDATLLKAVYIPIIPRVPGGPWLSVWADAKRAPVLRAMAPSFKQKYGADLVVTRVDNMHDAIMFAIPLGWGPDVFVGPHDRLGAWLDADLLAPVNLGPKRSLFSQLALQGFSSGGQLYGLPYAIENMGLFRNVDLVAGAPKTWNQLLSIGGALQAGDKVSYTLALEDNGYKIYPIVSNYGGYVFGKDPGGAWDVEDLGVGEAGMIAAGQWISNNVGAGLLSPTAHAADEAEMLFEAGRVPFIMTGPWALDRFRDASLNYAISDFPEDGRPFVGLQGFFVSSTTKKNDLVHTFLTDFLATTEIMDMLYRNEKRPPAYLPLLNTIVDPDMAAFVKAGKNGELMPAVPEMGCVWGPWNHAVIQVIQGDSAPGVAFPAAAEDITPCIGGLYKGMVNVPGSYQTLVGCERNWDPACLATAMTLTVTGQYTSSHHLPAGDYEAKVALDGSWTINYGKGGIQDGQNIPFSLSSAGTVQFTYDPSSHILRILVND